VQLNVLDVRTVGTELAEPWKREWQEIARWIKYEQDLEEGANRLGRPHIAPLGFHFVMRLNALMEKNGNVGLGIGSFPVWNYSRLSLSQISMMYLK